jgi:hypothetical protein
MEIRVCALTTLLGRLSACIFSILFFDYLGVLECWVSGCRVHAHGPGSLCCFGGWIAFTFSPKELDLVLGVHDRGESR